LIFLIDMLFTEINDYDDDIHHYMVDNIDSQALRLQGVSKSTTYDLLLKRINSTRQSYNIL